MGRGRLHRAAGLCIVLVVLAGCGVSPTATVDGGEPADEVAAGGAEGRSGPRLEGDLGPWVLTGVSPDGRLLTIATWGGGCSTFRGWVSEEATDRVRIEARWEHDDGADACPAVLRGDALTLILDEPLGGRQLTGCQHDDCRAEPPPPEGEPTDAEWGAANGVSVADDAVIVTGHDTVWSLDPDDGAVRWERPRDSHWSLALDDVVLRYDHRDHVEARDAVTGELRWEAGDVTLADVRGDEVLVCPREQAMEDPPYERFRGALSLEDGSWLWREDDADCTTGAIERRESERRRADAATVDPDPDLVGHSLGVDVAVHDGVAYVATSTALVALEPDTGDRRWWTLLVPDDAQPSNGVHAPTAEAGGDP